MLDQAKISNASAVLPATVPHILAPAGGREQFFAALNSGADAVYLGLKDFNARARAQNFTHEDLLELLPIARRFGMQVLVTVNILLKESELPAIIRELGFLADAGVDAIIVQDLAVVRLARQHFPELRVHASTQMAIHNAEGVMAAARLGIRRTVLARELTAIEMKRIRAAIPIEIMELEVFCHGSLCYSYSGLCFFSGANDARSGNRGECAYTCRQPYEITSEPGHGFLFSMRDLDTSGELHQLVAAGVDCLKIEGRKKDAQYVSSVVQLYRHRLDEIFGRNTLRVSAPDEAKQLYTKYSAALNNQDLALSFHRRHTSLFIANRYRENVIDLDNPTHLGLEAGIISRVMNDSISFTTQISLERFDGLKIVRSDKAFHALPQDGTEVSSDISALNQRYDNELVQFSLRDFSIDRKRTAVAGPGTEVTIPVPDGARMPRVGDKVFKVRSADLKRRVEKLATAPSDVRLRPLRPLDLDIVVEELPDTISITVTARHLGASIAVREEFSKVEARQPQLHADLRQTLSIFGDQGFEAEKLEIIGPDQWFVPRSGVKQLKSLLASKISSTFDTVLPARIARALAALPESPSPAVRGVIATASMAIKLDRIENLQWLSDNLASLPPIHEVIFEAKRAFLASAAPDFLDSLLALQSRGLVARLAIPMVIREWDKPLLNTWLQQAEQRGLRHYEIGNLSGFDILRQAGIDPDHCDLAADFTLYTLNSLAAQSLAEQGIRRVTLSVEDDCYNLAEHVPQILRTGLQPQAILYKDTPLFIAEACSLTALHDGCPTAKVCGYRSLTIRNRQGDVFHVAHESCKSIVYGEKAYSISQHRQQLQEMGVSAFRVDFLTRSYADEEMARIIHAAAAGTGIVGTHDANFSQVLL